MKQYSRFINQIKNTEEKMARDGVICYGASRKGLEIIDSLKRKQIKIIAFCDSDENKWGTRIDSYDIISPKQLEEQYKTSPIIVTSMYMEEISAFLYSKGMYTIINIEKPFFFFEQKYDAYIYGTTDFSIQFYSKFRNKLNIIGFITEKEEYDDQFYGMPCFSIRELEKDKMIFITSDDYKSAQLNLSAHGFKNVFFARYIYFISEAYNLFPEAMDAIIFNESGYSNESEDLIIAAIFRALHIEHPKYADIGANHPSRNNNTYLFYKNGCTGQLFEPLPQLCELLRDARPNDNIMQMGIGVKNQSDAIFYQHNCDVYSTFSEYRKNSWKDESDYTELHVPIQTFNDAVDKDVNFVSLDIEYMDFKVIKTIDFDLFDNLAVFCSETSNYETIEYMRQKNFVLYTRTGDNATYIKENLFDQVMKDKLCREIYYSYQLLNFIQLQ